MVLIEFTSGYRLVAQLKPRSEEMSYEEAKALLPERHMTVKVRTVRFGEYNPTPEPRKEDWRRTGPKPRDE